MATDDKKLIRIIGRVVDTKANIGIAAVRVELWDKDSIVKVAFDTAVADQQGAFIFEFKKGRFKDFFGDRQPRLFFKVFRDTALILNTRDSNVWTTDSPDQEIVIQVQAPPEAPPEPPSPPEPPKPPKPLKVKGQIRLRNGKPVAQATVRAFLTTPEKEIPIGEAQTDAAGNYQITSSDQSLASPPADALLVTRVFDKAGQPLGASSSPLQDRVTTVDIVAEAIPEPGDEDCVVWGQVFQKDGKALNSGIVRLYGVVPFERPIKDAKIKEADEGRFRIEYKPGEFSPRKNETHRVEVRVFRLVNTVEQELEQSRPPVRFRADEVQAVDINLLDNFDEPPDERKTFTVEGFVKKGGQPQGNVTVKAFDGRSLPSAPFAVAQSSHDPKDLGRYLITYRVGPAPSDFTSAPRLVIRAIGADESTVLGESVLGRPAEQHETMDVIIPVAPTPPGDFFVEGRVKSGPHPVDGVFVQAIDSDLTKTVLGEKKTNTLGAYHISYRLPAGSKKDRADLLIRVFTRGSDNVETDLLVPALFVRKADPHLTLGDIDIPGLIAGPSEYEDITAKVASVFPGLDPKDLTDDGVELVARTYDLDAQRVAFYAAAGVLAGRTAIFPEAHYAFLRGGLPGNVTALLSQDPSVLTSKLLLALDANIIPQRFRSRIAEILEQVQQAIIAEAFRAGDTGLASLASLLATVITSPARQREFVTLYVQHTGTIEQFWNSLRANLNFRDIVDDLQFAIQAGALTGNHIPLVRKLQQMRKAKPPQITSLRDLAKKTPAEWEVIIRQSAGAQLTFPPGVTGNNANEKVTNYARILSTIVADAFPTAVISTRFGNDTSLNIPNKQDVVSFLSNNPAFDLGATNVRTFIRQTTTNLGGISDRTGLINLLEGMQRINRVAPNYDEMSVLMSSGFDSAAGIVRLSKQTFINQFSALLGGGTRAAAIFDNAGQVAATAANLFADLNDRFNGAGLSVVANTTPEAAGIPDWATLFGPVDFCACQHCRSVLSPAAYLVDALRFLKDRKGIDQADPGRSALDVLFARRPDIGDDIELTCENTNTLVPYVDLLIEALNPATGPTPDARLLELFTLLSDETYPWLLPFNQAAEQTRAYLRLAGIHRYDLMETFQHDPARIEVATEYFGMTTRERSVITGAPRDPLWALWGYAASSGLLSTTNGVQHVRKLLDRSGLSHTELVELLDTHYINPNPNARIDIQPDSSCNIDRMDLAGVDEQALGRIVRFVRLWRKLGWTMHEVDLAITAIGAGTIDGVFITKLADVVRVRGVLNLKVDQVLALWSPIDTKGEDSLYNRLFLNKKVSDPVDPAFELNAEGTQLARPDVLKDHIPAILAALPLNAVDFDFIRNAMGLGDLPAPSAPILNLTNLSLLYRCALLSQGLRGFSARDFISLAALSRVDPFENPASTRTFIEMFEKVRASGFSFAELNYLLRGEVDAATQVAAKDDSIALVLDEIRGGLKKIVSETAETSDPSGEILAKKLGALGLDATLIDSVVGLLGGAQIHSTEFIPVAETPSFAEQFSAKLANEIELAKRISYDPLATKEQMSFKGAMTVGERQTLRSFFAATFTQYQTAIDALFNAPRDLVTGYLKHFATPTAAVSFDGPPLEFPANLQTKILFDARAKELRFTGEMNVADKAALLALSSKLAGPAAGAYETAINALSQALDAASHDPNNVFLTPSDAGLLFDIASAPQEKFEFVLGRANLYLRRTSSESLIKQKLAETLRLDAQSVEQLLTRRMISPARPPEKSISEFLDIAFISSTIKITRAAPFLNQFATFILLHKVALIVSKFKVTPRQLDWLFDYGPALGWLDLNSLASASPITPDLFHRWSRLVDLFALRDRLRNGEETLSTAFALSRKVSPPVTVDDLLAKLSLLTGWELDDLRFLDGLTGLALSLPPPAANPNQAYTDERAMIRLADCFAMMGRLRVSARQCRSWAKADLTPDDASAAKQAAKARFDDKEWEEADQPVSERLTEKLRAALVSYMVANPVGDPDPSVSQNWKDSNGLYDYFLIDPEMSPCMMTSKIKQAISSAQLFVQRCLMNLEPGVKASAEIDNRWGDWKWMKSYRVWEANRKVFLYPENWVEPELRDDKSPFFKELENELLQNDITTETAETAFIHYLEKLDEVARLEVVGMYHQVETDAHNNSEINIWHVFARTYGTPPIYYYRQWVNASYWTAWEKVDVDIEGNHLVPVVWNGRLFLIWPVFTREADQKPVKVPEPNHTIEDPPSFWKIKLAWSQLKNKKWSSKRISEEFLEVFGKTQTIERPNVRPDLSRFFFHAPVPNPALVVECHLRFFFNIEGDVELYDSLLGEFRFDECNSAPRATILRPIPSASDFTRLIRPWATVSENMALVESPVPRDLTPSDVTPSEEPLVFLINVRPETDELYVPDENGIDKVVLVRTPGTFRLLLPQQVYPYRSQDPFFFYDSKRTYFVTPKTNQFPTPFLGNFNQVNPGTIDDFGRRYFAPGQVTAIVAGFSAQHGAMSLLPNPPEAQSSIAGITSRSTTLERAAQLTPNLNLATSPGTGGFGSGRVPGGIAGILGDGQNGNVVGPGPRVRTKYLFKAFYHPYACLFTKHLIRGGIDGLLERPIQVNPPNPFDFDEYLKVGNQPARRELILNPPPKEDVDFSFGDSYSQYNWELFFHAPLEIAVRLTANQRFEEAQKWFHYIFDPTNTSDVAGSPGDPKTRRYWQTKPFFERMAADYERQRIERLLNPPDPASNSDMVSQINQWIANPFNPHAIARLRGVAYQKTVVMKYLDNLIEWGDQLFRRDTIESINEATQLYILAAELLGPRPEEIHPRREPAPQTYNDLSQRLDAFSNALENLSPTPSGASAGSGAPPPLPQVFCIPKNDKLLGYWDTVADRLFKIRHCQNIEGVVRQLALFEPPIDPALLVRAVAAGVDLSSVLSDVNAALPHYRFNVMAQKAGDLCAEVRGLGAALLAALEKRDAEDLALLRSSQEISLLEAVRLVKERQVDESGETLEGLRKSRDLANIRQNYYSALLSGLDTFSLNVQAGPIDIGVTVSLAPMNELEIAHLVLTGLGLTAQSGNAASEAIAGVLHLIPEAKVGVPTTVGLTYGGSNIASSVQAFGQGLGILGSMLYTAAGAAATLAGYKRRAEEWDFQRTLAGKEVEQIDRQIGAADIRRAIAEKELENHDKQIENAKAADEFMRDKFTNRELYDWMVGQVSAIYFQSYKLAYDVAKRAERAFRFELALDDSSFIQFGYWDSLKKGLLAGERLSHDVKRMEIAYLDKNKREYELTKNISIALLDPVALIKLKTGQCFLNLEESLFDIDYPGHYMRRIKSVALTIPCVTGPYTSVNCTLTLLKNSVRSKATATGEYARDVTDPTNPDSRFRDSVGAIQSIATSSAQNDTGLFELNFRDERYLPFEGAGAISTWRIQLPRETNRFDFTTISDVILHLRYTARDGGDALKDSATKAVIDPVSEGARLFSVKHEFSGEWSRFLNPIADTSPHTMNINLGADRFPFMPSNRTVKVKEVGLYFKLKGAAVGFEGPLALRLEPPPGSQLALTGKGIDGVLQDSVTLTDGSLPLLIGIALDRYSLPDVLKRPDGPATLSPDAVEDLFLVCHYSVEPA